MIIPSLTAVLEMLGYKLWLDLDGDLEYESPIEEITTQQVTRLLRTHIAEIEQDLRFRYARKAKVYVGGPFNGERHKGGCGPSVILLNIARARWAAYRMVALDPRAFYAGEATSKAKARRLAYAFQPPVRSIDV